MYGALDVSVSALVAHRTNLNVIAGNIAMMEVTRDDAGRPIPYRRRVALYAAGPTSGPENAAGVHVAKVVEDPAPFGFRYDPTHHDAIKTGDRKGYVRVSNVDHHTEMVNAMVTARAYEANIAVIETTKSMARSTLRLIA
ncbi:MAG: flagellar basal body rod protein FlgC [Planctomycetes bacterium]|nr:flagellar basal body rod protein FlgC [Planctomycetota bacterium]